MMLMMLTTTIPLPTNSLQGISYHQQPEPTQHPDPLLCLPILWKQHNMICLLPQLLPLGRQPPTVTNSPWPAPQKPLWQQFTSNSSTHWLCATYTPVFKAIDHLAATIADLSDIIAMMLAMLQKPTAQDYQLPLVSKKTLQPQPFGSVPPPQTLTFSFLPIPVCRSNHCLQSMPTAYPQHPDHCCYLASNLCTL